MTLARVRSFPGLLSLTVLAGSLTGVGLASPAHAAEGDPSGSYKLNFASLWIGQSVELTESELKDDVTPPTELKREVTWGDGTPTETLAAGSTFKHTYAKAGKFTVTVKVTDKDGKTADGTFPGGAVVDVTAVPGKFKIAKKTLYWGESLDLRTEKTAIHNQAASIAVSGLPADAEGTIAWGDGGTSSVDSATAKATHKYGYETEDTYPVSVVLTNPAGDVEPRDLGLIDVQEDTFNPKASIKTPKNKTKVSSWKTIKGSASDKGLGVHQVVVFLIQKRGKSWFYYTGKTWRKASSKKKADEKAAPVFAKLKSGTWSVKVAGLKKGTLEIGCLVTDKNLARGLERFTNMGFTAKTQKLTK